MWCVAPYLTSARQSTRTMGLRARRDRLETHITTASESHRTNFKTRSKNQLDPSCTWCEIGVIKKEKEPPKVARKVSRFSAVYATRRRRRQVKKRPQRLRPIQLTTEDGSGMTVVLYATESFGR